MELIIEGKESIKLMQKLKQLHKSDYPIAIRQTLNDLAFETKKQIPITAREMFINRNKSFFRAFTEVEKASGFDLSSMKSKVKFTDKSKDKIQNIEHQEKGGNIESSSFIYTREARKGSDKKLVSSEYYIKNKKQVQGEFKRKFKSSKAKFIAKSIIAKEKNMFMIVGDRKKIAMIVEAYYLSANGKVDIRTKKFATFEKGGLKYSVKRKRPFMYNSAMIKLKLSSQYFIKNAEKRIQRTLNKR